MLRNLIAGLTWTILVGLDATARENAARVGDQKITISEIACDVDMPKEFCDAQMQTKLDARITDIMLRKAVAHAGLHITQAELEAFAQKRRPSDEVLKNLERGGRAVIAGAERVLAGKDREQAYKEIVKPAGVPDAVFFDFLDKVQTTAALDASKVSVSASAIRAQMQSQAENELRLIRIEELITKTCSQTPGTCEGARQRFWREFLATCPITVLDKRFRAGVPALITASLQEGKNDAN